MKEDDLKILHELNDVSEDLTEWEYGFVEDLIVKQIQAEDNDLEFNLTQAQSDKLMQIHMGI